MNENEILKCGQYITDDELLECVSYAMEEYKNVRIRIILYEGNLYYHKMISGECSECKVIGRSL